MWNLPTSVTINGNEFEIRNKCDYRVILDVISALNDNDLEMQHRVVCALFQFYGNDTDLNTVENVLNSLGDIQSAISEMLKIINLGNEETKSEHKPRVMDWEHDFPQIAPPISRVLGYSVRDTNNYTHWFDFIGAYQEIGECSFATVISIRNKRMKGKKLEKWEQEFYNENKAMVDLPLKLTEDDLEWLDADY